MLDFTLQKLSEPVLKTLVFVFVTVVVFGLYGPSLRNGFAYDDEPLILNNAQIASLSNIPKAFSSCIWEPHLKTCKERTNYYRPLHTLSIIFTYAASSKPFLFHLINIVYYIIFNFLVFLFVSKIFKDRLAALLGLFFFLLHPVHAEPVMWISALPELLLGIFSLLTLLFYIADSERHKCLVGLFFFLALLSKETAAVLLLVVVVYDYLWRGIKLGKKAILNYLVFIAPLFLYVVLRISAIGLGKKIPFDFHVSLADKLGALIIAFGLYFKKMFLPQPFGPLVAIEAPSSFSNPQFVISLIIALFLIGFASWAVWKKKKILGLGLAIYLAYLTPALFLIFFAFVKGDFAIADRYLSLPILGISLIFGYYGAFALRSSEALRRFLTIIFIIIGVIFGYMVYGQNHVWNSTRSLYEYIHLSNAERGVPADSTTFSLALAYEEEGRIDKAAELYQALLSRGRDLPLQASQAANELGLIYMRGNKLVEADSFFRESLSIFPYNVAARRNIELVDKKIKKL